MASPKKLVSWLVNQSDNVHSGICVATTGAVLAPLLPTATPVQLAAANFLATSVQIGSQVYVGFISGPTMFMNMERTKFGDIQSRLFPKYGMVGMSSGLVALSTYYMAHNQATDTSFWLLFFSTAANFLNSFALFPLATKHMFDKRKFEENTPERKAAEKKFGMSHGICNLFNYAAFGCNLYYLYLIAKNVAGRW